MDVLNSTVTNQKYIFDRFCVQCMQHECPLSACLSGELKNYLWLFFLQMVTDVLFSCYNTFNLCTSAMSKKVNVQLCLE